MLEGMQADTIAAAREHLGRLDDAANALAICELVHAELSWPPVARHRAGLEWIRDIALMAPR
jgi:hypothetical protein